MVFIYTTCPTIKSAESLGQALLAQRLIACYNLWPIYSKYWWQGRVVASREAALILKTIALKQIRVKRFIEKQHPYKAPCIAVLSVRQLNAEYKKWLIRECQ